VQRILEKHGGKICAESQPDEGATFGLRCHQRRLWWSVNRPRTTVSHVAVILEQGIFNTMKYCTGVLLLFLLVACNRKPPADGVSLIPPNIPFVHNCETEHLSKQFTVGVTFDGPSPFNESNNYHMLLYIKDKATGKNTDSFSMGFPKGTYVQKWKYCEDITSYTTGYNANRPFNEGSYGELVVADFNFDGLDDFATHHNGFTGGSPYAFYLQGTDKQFRPDNFLRDSMCVIPEVIDTVRKTLTTRYFLRGRLYQNCFHLDKKTGSWKHTTTNGIVNPSDKNYPKLPL
jgi:hypothetical protein